MINWIRPIEQMMLASSRDSRIVGITAPHAAAGVSTVSSAFAEMSVCWGVKTLLIDLSTVSANASSGKCWTPGLGDPKLFLETIDGTYDLLQAIPSSATLGAFNSARYFRASLVNELEDYAAIVLDIPPILDLSPDTINPLVAVAACDAVIIVCAKGCTTADHLKQTVDAISVAGGVIAGTVLNDLGKPKAHGRAQGPNAR